MYSLEHISFLKERKKKKIFILVFQILIISIFIIIWQVAASNKWINTFIYSSPKDVLNTIIKLYKSNDLLNHIWITIYETIISFSLATILGIVIATILWSNKTTFKILEPYLTVLNSLPKVALGPIIIIWFGAGIKSIIFMALLISLIITILNVYHGFVNVDKNKMKLMKSFRATKSQIYFKLILPASITNIINCIKINISMTLIGVIMGEFLVSKAGVGYLIMYGSQVFNLNLVVTGIILLAVMASIMYYLILFIEKRLSKNR